MTHVLHWDLKMGLFLASSLHLACFRPRDTLSLPPLGLFLRVPGLLMLDQSKGNLRHNWTPLRSPGGPLYGDGRTPLEWP